MFDVCGLAWFRSRVTHRYGFGDDGICEPKILQRLRSSPLSQYDSVITWTWMEKSNHRKRWWWYYFFLWLPVLVKQFKGFGGGNEHMLQVIRSRGVIDEGCKSSGATGVLIELLLFAWSGARERVTACQTGFFGAQLSNSCGCKRLEDFSVSQNLETSANGALHTWVKKYPARRVLTEKRS